MSIEIFSGDEDDRRRLLRIDKLLQVRDVRVSFAKKSHRNSNGHPMDFRDPYLHDIYNSLSPKIALQASVQGQPLDALVHTPFGWREMGELKVGDVVSRPDGSDIALGKFSSITKIHELGKVGIYGVVVSGGRFTRATWDHLWQVNIDGTERVLNTLEVQQELVKSKVFLPRCAFDTCSDKECPQVLSIDLLGNSEARCITVDHPDGLYVTDDYIVSHNCGKYQPLDSLVHTPLGWKRMGDIQLEDVVSTPDGSTGKVIGIYPQGKKPIYRMYLSDGRYVDSGGPHLWRVLARKTGWKKSRGIYHVITGSEVASTEEIMSRLDGERFSLPLPVPLEKSEEQHKLDPYFLGVMLGDGWVGQKAFGFASADSSIIEWVDGYVSAFNLKVKQRGKYTYSFVKLDRACPLAQRELRSIFSDLGLLGKKSYQKFIPESYKRGSIAQRLSLLQGLLDTDGTSSIRGRVDISVSSKKFAEDIQEVAWSLGAVAKIFPRITRYTYKGVKKEGRVSYRVGISHPHPKTLFRLERQRSRLPDINGRAETMGPYIDKIERLEDQEAQCICIDHPDKLYITDNYIVTHNSEFLIIDHFAMAKCGLSILFVLPKYDLRNRFVQNRINKCVERVPEYSKIMGAGFFDSVQLKYFGGGTINYVGSNVEKDFYEIPTNCAIVDEYDQCDQQNLRFVVDRMSAATNLYPFIRYAGNPKYSNLGINQKFNESDRREWSVACDKCGTINHLDWFKHVVSCISDKMGNVISYELLDNEWKPGIKRDILMLCEACRNPIDRFSPTGHWIPTNPEGTYEGYHISKLFTRQASLTSMWQDFGKSVNNPSLMDWFYMSVLGIPPSSQGNRVTPEILSSCAKAKEFIIAGNESYVSEEVRGPCSMGIDVGTFLDVRISRILAGKRIAVYIGRVNTQEDLYELMKRYSVEYAVIDSGPELHLVDEVQNSAPCPVWRCRFLSTEGKNQNVVYDSSNMEIKVDRTFIMDRALASLRRGRNILPKNYKELLDGSYFKQMTASVRERVVDPSGNDKYEWLKTEDHHWLADCYDLLAADFEIDGSITGIEVL